MASRLQLQNNLEQILGTRNVYFQPPESKKLSYPCIIFEFANLDLKRAENKVYLKKNRYSITYIDSDPENDIVDKIIDTFSNVGFDRAYTSSNLYHYVLTIYY